VTGGAIVIEVVRHMIGISHSRKISLVAGVAIGRRVDITGGVAGNARSRYVGSGQWERGRTVVEGRRIPGSGRVTGGAIVIEVVRHMVGIGHSRKISLVAGVAVGRCTDISSGVTGNARGGHMRSGQRESGSGMAEIGW
jgi:hypothetical protein